MKKLVSLLFIIIMLCGCGNNSAKGAVESYLKKYKTLDSEVLVDMETIIDKENLSEDAKDKYREVLKKQYKDLAYEITDEEADGDISYVTVKIKVYDLYQAQVDAYNYLENNRNEFMTDDVYDENKYIEYKLDKMQSTTNKIEYTITFTVTKDDDDKYLIVQPTENDLLKIHGIYNYDLD